MLPGHTKFMPDGFFGMIKKKCQQERIDGKMKVVECINTSSKDGRSNTAITYGSGLDQFRYYDFRPRFEGWFSKIDGILQFQHFHFSSQTPGIVHVQKRHNQPLIPIDIRTKKWQNVDALGLCLHISQDMLETNSAPLSEKRKDYIYKEILPHIDGEDNKTAMLKAIGKDA